MATYNNLQLMETLDDAWNNRDWDTFSKRHTEQTVVFWPGKPEPTHGVHDHKAEGIGLCKTFPDNHIENRPYKVLIAQGDWTCSIGRFTGTMTGPMTGTDGKQISPTNKSFAIDFCTVAHWQNGEIVEENLFYDLVGMMKQIGLG